MHQSGADLAQIWYRSAAHLVQICANLAQFRHRSAKNWAFPLSAGMEVPMGTPWMRERDTLYISPQYKEILSISLSERERERYSLFLSLREKDILSISLSLRERDTLYISLREREIFSISHSARERYSPYLSPREREILSISLFEREKYSLYVSLKHQHYTENKK